MSRSYKVVHVCSGMFCCRCPWLLTWIQARSCSAAHWRYLRNTMSRPSQMDRHSFRFDSLLGVCSGLAVCYHYGLLCPWPWPVVPQEHRFVVQYHSSILYNKSKVLWDNGPRLLWNNAPKTAVEQWACRIAKNNEPKSQRNWINCH